MTSKDASPPRWAEALLRSLVRPSDRESISGDLLEEYRVARRPSLGALGADAWYIKHVLSVLVRLMWPPCALLLVVLTLGALIPATEGRAVGYGSPVRAPGISLLHALSYAWAGYYGFRRTHLIATGMLAAGLTSLMGVMVFFAAAAIENPGLLLAPFSKPFIFVILAICLLLALGYGILMGAVGGVIGRWMAPAAHRNVRAS